MPKPRHKISKDNAFSGWVDPTSSWNQSVLISKQQNRSLINASIKYKVNLLAVIWAFDHISQDSSDKSSDHSKVIGLWALSTHHRYCMCPQGAWISTLNDKIDHLSRFPNRHIRPSWFRGLLKLWWSAGNWSYLVKIRERLWSWFKEANIDCWKETGGLSCQSHMLCTSIHPDLSFATSKQLHTAFALASKRGRSLFAWQQIVACQENVNIGRLINYKTPRIWER